MDNSVSCNENNNIFKLLNFRLPTGFKKAGLIGAILTFICLITYKFIGNNALLTKDILRTLILLFLLITSLSKEEFEDEYSRHIRFQSFLIASVFAAAYAILIPLIAIFLDFIISNLFSDGAISFYKISAFEVLFTLLGMQILCFEALKRFGRA